MNILIVYLVVTGDLKTLYDTDGKYNHVTVGTYLQDNNGVAGWVLDLPDCVQEGSRMLREEREWLLSEGRRYAQEVQTNTQKPTTGTAVLVYDPQTESLATVFDCEKRYQVHLGTAIDGT